MTGHLVSVSRVLYFQIADCSPTYLPRSTAASFGGRRTDERLIPGLGTAVSFCRNRACSQREANQKKKRAEGGEREREKIDCPGLILIYTRVRY